MDTPTSIDTGRIEDHDAMRRLQVIDTATGEPIKGVIAANVITGTVLRYEVENGNLVLDGDVFVTVDEVRAIRIEVIGENGPEIMALPGAEG